MRRAGRVSTYDYAGRGVSGAVEFESGLLYVGVLPTAAQERERESASFTVSSIGGRLYRPTGTDITIRIK